MSVKSGADIPITWEQLQNHLANANQYLKGINYVPKKTLDSMRGDVKKPPRLQWSESGTGVAQAESVSIVSIAKEMNNGDDIFAEPINAALNNIRTGLQVALHVSEAYAKASGFAQLKERNSSGGKLGSAEEAEWATKQETHAAITVFVLAYYVRSRFASKDAKKITAPVDYAGLPEPIAIGNQIRSIGCILYHLGSYLKRAQTAEQFHTFVELYFADVVNEIAGRSDSLKYIEPFTDVCYKLGDTDFILRGFEVSASSGAVVEFKRVELSEVMGNQEAKRLTLRLSQFVMAYDFERRMNPMMELGALPWLALLQGRPGTGKSMLLGVIQTLVQDYCKALNVPFELRPIPNAIVSSLQGESAVQYERWWSTLANPSKIIIAPVDDAEAVYLDRREESSSEGSKLVVMSHLRLTEGSTAFIRGNVLQPHATNNADMIDPAVFSRYQARVAVPGAQTRNDYCDQMRGWGDKLNKLAGSELIKLKFPKDYVHLSDQGVIPKDEAERKKDGLIRFKDKVLVQLWDEVEGDKLAVNSYDLYGRFFSRLHAKFDQFTSRDVRNITTSATSRLFGFDFPAEWFEKRDAFVEKDYDIKKTMILDMALQHQKGLSVEQVLFQEMAHYVEATIEMLDSGKKHRVRQMADDALERQEATDIAAGEWKQRRTDATSH